MSAKNSSLAYEEIVEQEVDDTDYEPKLSLVISSHMQNDYHSSGQEIAKIGGRITVSF